MKLSHGVRIALFVVWGILIVPTTYHLALLWIVGPLGVYLAWSALHWVR